MTRPLIAVSASSATNASTDWRRGGGSRATDAIPINSGTTVRMPSPSDATQCHQIVRMGSVEL
jgi:hypothetical protein